MKILEEQHLTQVTISEDQKCVKFCTNVVARVFYVYIVLLIHSALATFKPDDDVLYFKCSIHDQLAPISDG